ncbi:MAG: hypothetical protein ACO1NW_02115 [Chitinophagaceae bacterium]
MAIPSYAGIIRVSINKSEKPCGGWPEIKTESSFIRKRTTIVLSPEAGEKKTQKCGGEKTVCGATNIGQFILHQNIEPNKIKANSLFAG